MAATGLGACPDTRTGAAAISQDSALRGKEVLWNALFVFLLGQCVPQGEGVRAVSARDGDGCLTQEKWLLGRALLSGRIRPSLGGNTSWLSLQGDRRCSEVPLSPCACGMDRWVGGSRSLCPVPPTSPVYPTTRQLLLWQCQVHKIWDHRTATGLGATGMSSVPEGPGLPFTPWVSPVCYYGKLSQ